MHGRILVATDGTQASIGALRMARTLELTGMGRVFVIAVTEPVLFYDDLTPGMTEAVQREVERAEEEAMRHRVLEQLVEVDPETQAWHVGIEAGSPAEAIADEAADRKVSMILTGLGRRSLADRLLGGETVTSVLQLTHVPVLAVHESGGDLPRRVIIAEDFSEPASHAAEVALDLAERGADIHLAHVRNPLPRVESEFMTGRTLDGYLEGIEARVQTRVRELTASGHDISAHVLTGDPADQLLRLADRIDADLIAAGRHGRGFLGRLVVGSVSSRLVRRTECSVLIAPPRDSEESID